MAELICEPADAASARLRTIRLAAAARAGRDIGAADAAGNEILDRRLRARRRARPAARDRRRHAVEPAHRVPHDEDQQDDQDDLREGDHRSGVWDSGWGVKKATGVKK